MRIRPLVLAVVCAAVLLAARPAEGAVFVRVLTQRAKVHTGPGSEFRTVYVAERGSIFPVLERGTRGYWLRVELDDGTTGWVFGEQVLPFEVVEDGEPGLFTRVGRAIAGALFAPSPLPYANVELSFTAGVIGGEGLFLFRPGIILDPYFAIEAFLGESPRAQETLLLGGVGWTLRLAPGGSFCPYIHGSIGAGHFIPKADAFTLEEKTLMTVDVGIGFELTFKKQITLRADFRNWTFFDQNETTNAQEFSGGLAIFF
jgi:hypothetical protein